MAFSESWLDELIAKNDIVSVVSSYVELKPKGRRLWGLCPLHGEKTASFSVSPDKQMFYCFGCHAGGTVIQFIMDVERMTFPEAVRLLAERVGMQMPEETEDSRLVKERAYRERLTEACKLAARYYMETLLGEGGAPGRAYLKKRGITGESVKRFGIGFAPDSWDALKTWLFDKGFSQQELLDAGLLVFNERKNSVYDAYRNRVIYPIIGASGRVLGFGARVLDDSKPKYINTGDTPIYNKRNNLYGLNLQKGKAITDLVMVEGYMDVIGLYEAGVTNAVASLGTALTVQQARLIKRYTDTVYIAYDGDAAGQNAMVRGLDILAKEGLSVRVIVFPDGLDPDEFVRQRGKEAFDSLKDDALSLNAFKLDAMAQGYTLENENQREKYAMEACRFVASLQPVERDRYYQQVARKTGYTVEALKAQGDASKPLGTENGYRSPSPWKNNQNRRGNGNTQRTRAEAALLTAALNSQSAAEKAALADPDVLFSVAGYKTFFLGLAAAYAAGTKPNAAGIIAGMERTEAGMLGELLQEDVPAGEPDKVAEDCIRRILRCDQAEKLEKLKETLADPMLDSEGQKAILMEIQKLNRDMRGAS